MACLVIALILLLVGAPYILYACWDAEQYYRNLRKGKESR